MLFPFSILNKSFSPLYQCTLSANLRIKFLYSFSKKKKKKCSYNGRPQKRRCSYIGPIRICQTLKFNITNIYTSTQPHQINVFLLLMLCLNQFHSINSKKKTKIHSIEFGIGIGIGSKLLINIHHESIFGTSRTSFSSYWQATVVSGV